MALSDATWRDHPFEKGKAYTAQESFTGFPGSEFIAGHDYVFDGVAYSHYDSSTIFQFHEQGAAVPVSWWWHDGEPDSLCQQRFRRSETDDFKDAEPAQRGDRL